MERGVEGRIVSGGRRDGELQRLGFAAACGEGSRRPSSIVRQHTCVLRGKGPGLGLSHSRACTLHAIWKRKTHVIGTVENRGGERYREQLRKTLQIDREGRNRQRQREPEKEIERTRESEINMYIQNR